MLCRMRARACVLNARARAPVGGMAGLLAQGYQAAGFEEHRLHELGKQMQLPRLHS